jgi:hypothetical protein
MITAANITFAFKGSTRRASLTHKFMKGDANGVPLINLFETADKYGGGHSCSWTKQGHLATETSHSTDLKSPTRKEDLSSCSRLFRKIRNLARACVLMALSFPASLMHIHLQTGDVSKATHSHERCLRLGKASQRSIVRVVWQGA